MSPSSSFVPIRCPAWIIAPHCSQVTDTPGNLLLICVLSIGNGERKFEDRTDLFYFIISVSILTDYPKRDRVNVTRPVISPLSSVLQTVDPVHGPLHMGASDWLNNLYIQEATKTRS